MQEEASYWMDAMRKYMAERSKSEAEWKLRGGGGNVEALLQLLNTVDWQHFFNVRNALHALSLYYKALHLYVTEHLPPTARDV